MEKTQKEPTIKRRKNLMKSNVMDIAYNELYLMYERECKIKNLSETTI